MNCGTCKWFEPHQGVCCFGDSPHCADFVFYDDVCACWEQKPMTNADRIRAMTDEELADLLVFGIKVGDENMYFDVKLKTICNSRLLAQDCCLDWLKQPAEG